MEINKHFTITYYAKKHKKHIWSRVGLPPFEKMKKDVAQACIKNWPKLLSANLKRALEAQ